MMTAAFAAGLLAGTPGVLLYFRRQSALRRELGRLREDMDRLHRECLARTGRVAEDPATPEENPPLSAEPLRDGPLSMSARAQALHMLRSGTSADLVAAELGMASNEVLLLKKVAMLAPLNCTIGTR